MCSFSASPPYANQILLATADIMFIKHLLVITEQGTKKSLPKSWKIFSHIHYFKSLLEVSSVLSAGARGLSGFWKFHGEGVWFFFFLTLQTEQLVGPQSRGLQGSSSGRENNLFCHCQQRIRDSWSWKDLLTLLCPIPWWDRWGDGEAQREREVCSRGHRGLRDRAPARGPGLNFGAWKLSGFFIHSAYLF